MKIRYNISTTPARCASLGRVVEGLGACGAPVAVFYDDPPSGGSWANYRRVLLDAGRSGEDWTVSLDDDAILCDDFTGRVSAMLAAAPPSALFVGLYLSNNPVTQRALASGASWVSTIRVVHGIAWAVRPAAARGIVEYADRHVRPEYYSGDQRILAWLVDAGQRNLIATPNLVDHDTEVGSCITGRPACASSRSASYRRDLSGERWAGGVYEDTKLAADTWRLLAGRGMFTHVDPARVMALAREARARVRSRLVDTANDFIRAYERTPRRG